jgi:hypothetical protein
MNRRTTPDQGHQHNDVTGLALQKLGEAAPTWRGKSDIIIRPPALRSI